jgi:translation initiation factor IF-3
MAVAPGDNVKLRVWTSGREMEPRKLGVRVHLLFVRDAMITEPLQDCDGQ